MFDFTDTDTETALWGFLPSIEIDSSELVEIDEVAAQLLEAGSL